MVFLNDLCKLSAKIRISHFFQVVLWDPECVVAVHLLLVGQVCESGLPKRAINWCMPNGQLQENRTWYRNTGLPPGNPSVEKMKPSFLENAFKKRVVEDHAPFSSSMIAHIPFLWLCPWERAVLFQRKSICMISEGGLKSGLALSLPASRHGSPDPKQVAKIESYHKRNRTVLLISKAVFRASMLTSTSLRLGFAFVKSLDEASIRKEKPFDLRSGNFWKAST